MENFKIQEEQDKKQINLYFEEFFKREFPNVVKFLEKNPIEDYKKK